VSVMAKVWYETLVTQSSWRIVQCGTEPAAPEFLSAYYVCRNMSNMPEMHQSTVTIYREHSKAMKCLSAGLCD
jgi:hypothetical protein